MRCMAKIDLSPSHALYALEQAMEDRKITRADLDRYAKKMRAEIDEIEARLAALKDAALAPLTRVVRRGPGRPRKGSTPVRDRASRVKTPVSAKRKQSMKVQGEYLLHIRQIPEKQRARFKKIAKEEGREKAIAAMKAVLAK